MLINKIHPNSVVSGRVHTNVYSLFVLEKGCVRSLIARHRLALNIDNPLLHFGLLLLETLRLLQLGGGFRWLLRRDPPSLTPVLEVLESCLAGEACLRDHLLILYFFEAWQSRSSLTRINLGDVLYQG